MLGGGFPLFLSSLAACVMCVNIKGDFDAVFALLITGSFAAQVPASMRPVFGNRQIPAGGVMI